MRPAGSGSCRAAGQGGPGGGSGSAVWGGGLSVRGDRPWRPGAGPGGSQPYLGPRGKGAAPATWWLIGCPRLAGMRPLSLIRPSAWPAAAGSGWQRFGGSWPRWSPSG